ncbi:hypothetical protein SDC9_151233 [bioreactor metagenome]|uniref:Uncharacterized protein n=1 Tax=bioreactor metagenome TaxID=1076179 RepID=A0A645EQ91_9ZZZZ
MCFYRRQALPQRAAQCVVTGHKGHRAKPVAFQLPVDAAHFAERKPRPRFWVKVVAGGKAGQVGPGTLPPLDLLLCDGGRVEHNLKFARQFGCLLCTKPVVQPQRGDAPALQLVQ